MSKVTIPPKGFKYRFYPTEEQKKLLSGMFGAGRFVYNQLLELAIKDYEAYLEAVEANPGMKHEKPNVTGIGLTYLIKEIKKEHDWMDDYFAVVYQQKAHDLGRAFDNYFNGLKSGKKVGYPKFKSRFHHQSVRLVGNAYSVKNGVFKVGKGLGVLDVVWSRELPSKPSSCTISKTASGEYYVSFVCEYTPPRTSGKAITGIDMGITDLFTLSNGVKVDNPRHYELAQRKLRRLQQSQARKQKGSNNYEKAKIKVAKQHQRIANQRKDMLHKLSTEIVNSSRVIGVENLNISGMIRNPILGKHISRMGWGAFLDQIAYKARDSQHCTLVRVHPYFPSSRLCSNTGKHLGRKLDLSEREWDCPHCGETHDRDINAAEVLAKEAMYNLNFSKLSVPGSEFGGIVLKGVSYDDLSREHSFSNCNIQASPGQVTSACVEFLPLGTSSIGI